MDSSYKLYNLYKRDITIHTVLKNESFVYGFSLMYKSVNPISMTRDYDNQYDNTEKPIKAVVWQS